MTLDQDDLEQEVVDLLRRSAEGAAPSEVRNRVGVRLASAGVVGLVSSAAAATGATAAPVGALSMVGLMKTLLVGMAFGASTGLGLHVASNRVPRPSSVAQSNDASHAAAVARPSSDVSAPEATFPVNTVGSVLASSREAGAAKRSTKAAHLVNPGPELPVEPKVPTTSGAGLAEQQTLLDESRAALRRGDGSAALEVIGRHVQRFPSTAFEEERQAVVIRALVLTGQLERARVQAAAFARRFPRSLFTPSLDAALSLSGTPRDSVTVGDDHAQTSDEP